MKDEMEETTVYFVRHGETEYNRRGIVQGRGIDAELNDTGRAQAQAVGRRFADVDLDAVFSSPMRRARATAEAIASGHDVSIRFLSELEEMAWGVFEGVEESVARRDGIDAIYDRWRSGEFDFEVEGGESVLDVQERALEAVRAVLEATNGGTVVVVTHGRFLRVLLATVLDEYGLARMHEIEHANTAVFEVRHREGTFEAGLFNCTAHLDDITLVRDEAA